MAQAQKPDLVFQRNERVHVFRWGSQFSRPLAALQSTSLNKRCTIVSKYVCQSSVRVQDTPTIRVFPLHFSSPAHPCAFSYRKHYTQRLTELMVYGSCLFIMFSPDGFLGVRIIHGKHLTWDSRS